MWISKILLIFSIFLAFLFYYFCDKNKPLIVIATTYFGESLITHSIKSAMKNCKFQCDITDESMLYPYSDIAIFHLFDLKWNEFFNEKRNPLKLNIFYNLEPSTQNKMVEGFPPDFFNATMTFRRGSTIWMPYDVFKVIEDHERNDSRLVWMDKDVDEMLKKKTKLALQFVSNCKTHSKRELLIAELEKYANITVYGKCGKNKLPRLPLEESSEIQQHFFYFAFENSICEDYVTEKFWKIKQLIVPVVLKRSILKGLIEDEYFIAADDFESPKALIDYIIYLSKNIDEYKKYLLWTKKYKKTVGYDDHEFCKICEMVVKKEKHSIKNIYDWWNNKFECDDDFLNKKFYI